MDHKKKKVPYFGFTDWFLGGLMLMSPVVFFKELDGARGGNSLMGDL